MRDRAPSQCSPHGPCGRRAATEWRIVAHSAAHVARDASSGRHRGELLPNRGRIGLATPHVGDILGTRGSSPPWPGIRSLPHHRGSAARRPPVLVVSEGGGSQDRRGSRSLAGRGHRPVESLIPAAWVSTGSTRAAGRAGTVPATSETSAAKPGGRQAPEEPRREARRPAPGAHPRISRSRRTPSHMRSVMARVSASARRPWGSTLK